MTHIGPPDPGDVNLVRFVWSRARDSPGFRKAVQYLGAALLAASGLIPTVEPSWEDWTVWSVWAFSSGLAVTGLGELVDHRRSAKADTVAQDLADVRQRAESAAGEVEFLQSARDGSATALSDAASDVLREFCARLGHGESERITVYVVSDNGLLRPAFRWSQDASYGEFAAGTRERRSDFDYGLIGRAARTGKRQGPMRSPSPENEDQYLEFHRKAGLSVTDVAALNMRSRSYDVVPIPGWKRDVVGVVSIESTAALPKKDFGLAGDELMKMESAGSAIRGMLMMFGAFDVSEGGGSGVE